MHLKMISKCQYYLFGIFCVLLVHRLLFFVENKTLTLAKIIMVDQKIFNKFHAAGLFTLVEERKKRKKKEQ